MMTRAISILLVTILLAMGASCGSKEDKKMRFFNKGKALYEQGDYTKARLELKNALQIDQKFAMAYLMLGMVELKDKNYQKAFGLLSKSVTLDPNLLDAQLELAKLFLAGKAIEKAREKIDLVLAKSPENAKARLVDASVLLGEGKFDQAGSLLSDLRTEGCTDPDVYLMLERVFNKKGLPGKARTVLMDGIQANPESVALMLMATQNLANTNEIDPAAALLRRIIDLKPEDSVYRFALADLLWTSGRKSQAKSVIDAILNKDPANEDRYLGVARFYIKNKEADEGQQTLANGIRTLPKSFKLRFALSEFQMQRKMADSAVETLEACLNLDKDQQSPLIIEAKTRLASLHLSLKNKDKAEPLVDEVLRESPKNVEANFIKGAILLLKRENVDSISYFRTVVGEKPDFIQGHLRLAEAHLRNNQPELAADALGSALKNNPRSKELLGALARIDMINKDTQSAQKRFQEILRIDPDDHKIRAALGDLFVSKKEYSEAERAFATIREKAPGIAAGYLKLAQLYAYQGNRQKAVSTIEAGYEKNPRSLPLLSNLIQSYLLDRKPARAVRLCQDRLKKDPQDIFVLVLLGRVYESQKNFNKAEAAFEKAISLKPEWQTAHNDLARLYLAQGRVNEAIGRLESSLKSNPDNIGTYLSLGNLQMITRDFEQARRTYEKALTVDPESWPINNNLAFLLSETTQQADGLKRAAELAEKAVAQRPDDPTVVDTLGWIRFKQKEYSEAADLMEKALSIEEDNEALNYHFGMVLFETDRLVEARERLEKALASGKEFWGIQEARETLSAIRDKVRPSVSADSKG